VRRVEERTESARVSGAKGRHGLAHARVLGDDVARARRESRLEVVERGDVAEVA